MQVKGLLTGNLKSIFVYSTYQSPAELEKDVKAIANSKKGDASIEKHGENLWRLEFTGEEKFTISGKEYSSILTRHFFIIPYGSIWEFHTNESGEAISRVLFFIIQRLPKLQLKFIPPNKIVSLLRKYGTREVLENFSASRDYFESLTEGNPELKIKSNDVDIRLKSSPENIWGHYKKLIEQDAIGPLLLNDVKVTIGSSESCTLRINKSGKITQTSGDLKIFHQVREYFINEFKDEMKWEEYIPKIEPRITKEKGAVFYTQTEIRKGRLFSINLSKSVEKKEYRDLELLFTKNVKESGFIGMVEQDSKTSFSVRTVDTKGGGEAIIIVGMGKNKIQIAPLPTTTLQALNGIYRAILEKFDVKATFKAPEN